MIAIITVLAPNVGKHRKGARITLDSTEPAVARWKADPRVSVVEVPAPESTEPVPVGHRAAMAASAIEGHIDAALAVRAALPPVELPGFAVRIRVKHIAAKLAELVGTPGAALPEVEVPVGLVERLAELLGCPAEADAVIGAVELAVTPPEADPGDVEPDAWRELRAELDLAPHAPPQDVLAKVVELLDAVETPGGLPGDTGEPAELSEADVARLILRSALWDPGAFTIAGLITFAGVAGITLPPGADKARKEQLVALIEEAVASTPAPAGAT